MGRSLWKVPEAPWLLPDSGLACFVPPKARPGRARRGERPAAAAPEGGRERFGLGGLPFRGWGWGVAAGWGGGLLCRRDGDRHRAPCLCLPRLGFLPAGQQASLTLQLIPYKSGMRQLHLTLRSSLFPPLKGHKQLQVAEDGWRTGWLP